MRKLIIALAAAACLGAPASAQQQENNITLDGLLNVGFDIVAMQYLQQSMVFTLQRGSIAYICDLTFAGETKICVELK